MSTTTETPDTGVYSTKEFNSETGERVFNVEDLKTAMGTLQGHFGDFADILKAANDLVTSDVNASCEHCVFGDHGMFMLNLWKENAATFHDFNANFEKWSQAIAVIANKNADFTNVATDIYNNRKYSDNALTVSATYNGTDYSSAAEMRADIIDDNAIVTTDANGNTTTAYFDENGNYIVKVTDSNGDVVSVEKSYYVDADGDGTPDSLVVEKYGADGTTITEKTTTEFDDFGRIATITAVVGGVTTITNNTYDENGRLVKTETKDAAGNIKNSTTNTYDANGNLVKTETTENGQVTYSQETKYNEHGLVETVTTVENGVTTTESYEYGVTVEDADGKIISTDSIVKTITTDDGSGNVTTTTEVTTRQVQDITDADGKVIGTESTTVVQSKDADGNVLNTETTTTKIEGGKTTTTETVTDQNGKQTSQKTTETNVTSIGSQQKVTTTNENGETTSVETKRDINGDVTEVVSTDKDGNTATVTHKADGSTSVTYRDANGQEIPADQKPDSFNEDGSLNDDSDQQDDGQADDGEPTTEATTEAQTEATTEAQTEATTEAQTEATTEAQTEATTEAQTEATTEVQTEATTEAQTEAQVAAGTEPSTDASVTLTSGDEVEVNGEDYYVYGYTRTDNGRLVPMYANKQGNLYYENSNGELAPVMEQYSQVTGNGYQAKPTNVQVQATVNSLGTSRPYSIYGNQVKNSSSLVLGDLTITDSADVIGSATYENGSLPSNVNVTDAEGSAYTNINVGNTYTTDGSLLQSYEGNVNQVVNGDTVVTAASMSDFSNYVNNNPDANIVIRIPQGQTVQWDPSASVTGYDFNTDNGSVYLKWNSSENGYQIVDEYGNVTNDRVFTLDGFNTNAGKWK